MKHVVLIDHLLPCRDLLRNRLQEEGYGARVIDNLDLPRWHVGSGVFDVDAVVFALGKASFEKFSGADLLEAFRLMRGVLQVRVAIVHAPSESPRPNLPYIREMLRPAHVVMVQKNEISLDEIVATLNEHLRPAAPVSKASTRKPSWFRTLLFGG